MIKEAYCSFEVSKLLKEKGFEGECIAYYSRYKDNNLNLYRWRNRSTYVNVRNNGYTLVPTHQMAMTWLRENYKLHFVISYNQEYEVSIMTIENNPRCKCRSIVKNTYEEAVEAALKYCLENLI